MRHLVQQDSSKNHLRQKRKKGTGSKREILSSFSSFKISRSKESEPGNLTFKIIIIIDFIFKNMFN